MPIMNSSTAIITGGASGIGKAIATKLFDTGFNVVIFDLQEPDDKKHSLFIKADITNEGQVQAAVENITDKYESIEVLVNCAGITGQTNIKTHDVTSDDLQKVFAVNFLGSFYCSKHVLPLMLKRNYGRVLHMASIAGKEGNAGMLAYSASKAAVIGMVKVQGKEYADTGITINGMAPAVILTALVENMPAEQVKYMTDKIPMKRCGTLEEAANLAAYIVSPQNSFTTGFIFDLSGGRATY